MSHGVPFGEVGGKLQENLQASRGAVLRPSGEVPAQLAAQFRPARAIGAPDVPYMLVVMPGLKPGRQGMLLDGAGTEVIIALRLGDGLKQARRGDDPAQPYGRRQSQADRAEHEDVRRAHPLQAGERAAAEVKVRAAVILDDEGRALCRPLQEACPSAG